jgi:hypothetical protein
VVKNGTPERGWQHGTKQRCGNVPHQGKGRVQRKRSKRKRGGAAKRSEIWARKLGTCYIVVGEGRGRKRRERRGRSQSTNREWARESVGHHVGLPGNVPERGGEFRNERELALLACRERHAVFGYGRHKWLVVSENEKMAAIKLKTEMLNSRKDSEQLSVKRAIAHLRGSELSREEC